MKVVIGGMGLSGSTLCYNIFRIISERRGYKTPQKLHEWNHAAIKAKSIFMVRDLRDTVASMLRKDPEHWQGDVEKATYYQMRWYYDSWKGREKHFVWKYEDYKANPYEYAKSACDAVGIPMTLEEITEIVDEAENIKNLNIPTHQDAIASKEQTSLWWLTKLSKRHITNGGKIGGYRDVLSEEDIKLIESKWRYFFEKENYPLNYE